MVDEPSHPAAKSARWPSDCPPLGGKFSSTPGMEPLTRQPFAFRGANFATPRPFFKCSIPPSRTCPRTAGASRSRVQSGGRCGSRNVMPGNGWRPKFLPGNGPASRIDLLHGSKKIMPPKGQTNTKGTLLVGTGIGTSHHRINLRSAPAGG